MTLFNEILYLSFGLYVFNAGIKSVVLICELDVGTLQNSGFMREIRINL